MSQPQSNKPGRMALLIGLWLAAIAASCLIDAPVARYLHETGLAPRFKESWPAHIAKTPGNYFLTLALVPIFCLRKWLKNSLEGGFVCLCGVMGVVNSVVKWAVGRHRPYRPIDGVIELAPFHLSPFDNGLAGLIWQGNMAFPSGHTCTAFATAAALAKLLPRWRGLFFTVAALVGLERIVENAHHVSDVIAGAGLAILGVHVLWHICLRLVNRPKEAMPPVLAVSEVDLDHG